MVNYVGANKIGHAVFRKTATVADSGGTTYDFTLYTTVTPFDTKHPAWDYSHAVGAMLRVTGVDPVSPVAHASSAAGGSSGTSLSASTGTYVPATSSLIVAFFSAHEDVTLTAAAMTQQATLAHTNPYGPRLLTAARTGTGSAYTASATASAAGAWAASLVVLKDNAAPVADGDGPYATDEDTQLTVTAGNGVLTGDTDADGNPLTAVLGTAPTHAAAFTLNADGSLSYMPAPNWSGSDSFTYRAFDGQAYSAPITVSLPVAPVNDPPEAIGGSICTPARTTLVFGAPVCSTTTPTSRTIP